MHSALSEGVHGKFYGVSAIAAELPQDRTACVPLLSGVKSNKAVKSFTCDILPVQFRDVLFRKTSAASYPSPFHGIDGEDFLIAAVTLKQPVWFVPFIHVIESDGNELTEALSGDVTSFFDLAIQTSAAFGFPVEKICCRNFLFSTAGTFASPDRALLRIKSDDLLCGQATEGYTCQISRRAHAVIWSYPQRIKWREEMKMQKGASRPQKTCGRIRLCLFC